MLLYNTIFHIAFGTCNPENVTLVKISQMLEINVCLIKNGYFATFEIQAEPISFGGIMRRSFFNGSSFIS